MEALLGILALVLVIFGVYELLTGAVLFGLILIVVGLLIGPGGISLYRRP